MTKPPTSAWGGLSLTKPSPPSVSETNICATAAIPSDKLVSGKSVNILKRGSKTSGWRNVLSLSDATHARGHAFVCVSFGFPVTDLNYAAQRGSEIHSTLRTSYLPLLQQQYDSADMTDDLCPPFLLSVSPVITDDSTCHTGERPVCLCLRHLL